MDTTAATLTIARQDGAFSFTDPAVPLGRTVEQVTNDAVAKLRYPRRDVGSGKPLQYAMIENGTEVRADLTVGEAFPQREARVHVVSQFQNAAGGSD
jgi:hypothetical protein